MFHFTCYNTKTLCAGHTLQNIRTFGVAYALQIMVWFRLIRVRFFPANTQVLGYIWSGVIIIWSHSYAPVSMCIGILASMYPKCFGCVLYHHYIIVSTIQYKLVFETFTYQVGGRQNDDIFVLFSCMGTMLSLKHQQLDSSHLQQHINMFIST